MKNEHIPYKTNRRISEIFELAEPFISKSWRDPQKAFDNLQRRAEYCKGIVMPHLDTSTINIVNVKPHNFNSEDPLGEAKIWAENNLIGIYTAHKGTFEEFEYQISKKAIKKYIQSCNKSENIFIHLSTLKVLPTIIENSIEAEIHADYTKVNDERTINNPIDKTVLIHRFYGAVVFSGKVYRVKTTIKEYRNVNFSVKPYSFEVIKIMLLDESNSIILIANHPNSQGGLIINTANILQNVEKSYDKGKFLIEETKKYEDNIDEYLRFYFSE